MPDRSMRVVQSAEAIFEGLVITFNDGRCAFFDSDFLYSRIEQVREIFESDYVDPYETAPVAAGESEVIYIGAFREFGSTRERTGPAE